MMKMLLFIQIFVLIKERTLVFPKILTAEPTKLGPIFTEYFFHYGAK